MRVSIGILYAAEYAVIAVLLAVVAFWGLRRRPSAPRGSGVAEARGVAAADQRQRLGLRLRRLRQWDEAVA